jgi:hypothetical protein
MVIAAVSYNATAPGAVDSSSFERPDRRMGKLIAAQNGKSLGEGLALGESVVKTTRSVWGNGSRTN